MPQGATLSLFAVQRTKQSTRYSVAERLYITSGPAPYIAGSAIYSHGCGVDKSESKKRFGHGYGCGGYADFI